MASNGNLSTTPASDGLLVLENVSASYGEATVLRDVSLAVPPGTLVALLGANGAGKTTLLRVASGQLRPNSGRVWLAGDEITSRPPHSRVRDGLCLVPEGRGIYPSLTVRENLELQVPPWIKNRSLTPALDVFPVLGSRMKQVAGTLSGGQQQMLALARAVLAQPKIILLDEISMGLAPLLIDQLFEALVKLGQSGTAMLVVEQYIRRALEFCSFAYIISKGTIVYSGPSESLQSDTVIESYLGTSVT
jgi:branched-chain amino acid transport system ATP-binding protein